MDQKEHWERVYAAKPKEKLGWYKLHLETSLTWIDELGLAADDPIIDVGGGASTLVDDLLATGYQSITVLDISDNALALARRRLGKKADSVTWMARDITSVDLPNQHFKLWHDRAVFHFLTEADQRQNYRDNLLHALQPDGYLIIGTFAPDAPPVCSGLPVQRYDWELLQETLGRRFALVEHRKELHITPGGVEQMYLYCKFHRMVETANNSGIKTE